MRILLCADGTRGDVYPMLALGEVLAEAGHQIRVCAPALFTEAVTTRGFEFHPSGIDVVGLMSENAAAIVNAGSSLVVAQGRLTDQLLANGFGPTVDAAAGCDFILAAGIQFVAASAAEIHDIPYRYVYYTPALMPSREHAPALLPNPLPRWAIPLAWAAMPLLMWPIMRRINRNRALYGLEPRRDALGYVFGPRPALLAADADLAPLPSDARYASETIGALQDDAGERLPEKLERFIAAGPPPVYFGFGSMGDPNPTETSIYLLEALAVAGQRGVVSQGWAGLGDMPLPEHVMQIGEVPHTPLFSRMAAVVHHGGAGTTTRAARAGVPQIVVPHLLDQHDFARRVHSLGIGPAPLRRRGLRGNTLGAVLAATLDNEFLTERANELGERLRAADPLRSENRKTLLERVLGT